MLWKLFIVDLELPLNILNLHKIIIHQKVHKSHVVKLLSFNSIVKSYNLKRKLHK
jgi:hypothetical protein